MKDLFEYLVDINSLYDYVFEAYKGDITYTYYKKIDEIITWETPIFKDSNNNDISFFYKDKLNSLDKSKIISLDANTNIFNITFTNVTENILDNILKTICLYLNILCDDDNKIKDIKYGNSNAEKNFKIPRRYYINKQDELQKLINDKQKLINDKNSCWLDLVSLDTSNPALKLHFVNAIDKNVVTKKLFIIGDGLNASSIVTDEQEEKTCDLWNNYILKNGWKNFEKNYGNFDKLISELNLKNPKAEHSDPYEIGNFNETWIKSFYYQLKAIYNYLLDNKRNYKNYRLVKLNSKFANEMDKKVLYIYNEFIKKYKSITLIKKKDHIDPSDVILYNTTEINKINLNDIYKINGNEPDNTKVTAGIKLKEYYYNVLFNTCNFIGISLKECKTNITAEKRNIIKSKEENTNEKHIIDTTKISDVELIPTISETTTNAISNYKLIFNYDTNSSGKKSSTIYFRTFKNGYKDFAVDAKSSALPSMGKCPIDIIRKNILKNNNIKMPFYEILCRISEYIYINFIGKDEIPELKNNLIWKKQNLPSKKEYEWENEKYFKNVGNLTNNDIDILTTAGLKKSIGKEELSKSVKKSINDVQIKKLALPVKDKDTDPYYYVTLNNGKKFYLLGNYKFDESNKKIKQFIAYIISYCKKTFKEALPHLYIGG